MKVKAIDTKKLRKDIKKCPKEIRSYIEALERVLDMDKKLCAKMSVEIKDLKLKKNFKNLVNHNKLGELMVYGRALKRIGGKEKMMLYVKLDDRNFIWVSESDCDEIK